MFILSGLSEAVNFLTVFKLKRKNRKSGGEEIDKDGDLYIKYLKKSIKYFPAAGFLIGIILASIFYIFNKFLSVQPAILVSIFFLFILTGGLHFDGLSDTSDGFFAYLKSGDKNRFYKAMKDVNTGAAGNLSVIFYVLIMWSLINSVNGGFNLNFTYLSLLTFPVAGRYSIVVMSYFSNTPDNFKGIGTIFTEGTDTWSLIAASFFTLIIIYFFLKTAGIFSLLVTVFVVLSAAFYFGKKFGGVNGDMLGFTVQLSEVIFTAALVGFHRILY
ncbi:MAG: adenosylcobinamide-GDP ribazoletransferase [Deltaproteobacteria bacterium]|nr:adenosylcobinamide-GDP ribazoletransferase [Deltaproteobacteria bacterium]